MRWRRRCRAWRRGGVPVYRAGKQVGKATSTTWSPTLKKMIALACVKREHLRLHDLAIEMTVDAVRRTVSAKVVAMPFFKSGEEDGGAGVVAT